MKKKLFSLLLAAAMMCSMIPTAFAASTEAIDAANALHELGLFNGVGINADGTPNFDLDRTPTRHEAVTMLVAMLGKSSEAQAGNWTTPFTDVADWAKPFVGYAYTNGLTSGTSATTYGGNQPVTATQYLTFVLTALGYKNGTDFQWDKAWELSDKIGLTDGRYNANSSFTRGDVAIISKNALLAKLNNVGVGKTLLESLIASGVVDSVKADQFIESERIKDLPDASDVFDNFVWPSYIKVDGKYYDTLMDRYEFCDIDGELYVHFGAYVGVSSLDYVEQGAQIFALLTREYEIKRSLFNNPKVDGWINFNKALFTPKVTTVKNEDGTVYEKFQLKIKGKTFTSPEEWTTGGFIMDDIRYIGWSGEYYANANDVCKVLGTDKRFTYLKNDEVQGLNNVIVFE